MTNTFNRRLNTYGTGVVSDVLLGSLGSFGPSNIILPHQADPIRDDQYLIRPPVYAKVKRKKTIGYLFIWKIIDHSSELLIGCCNWYLDSFIFISLVTELQYCRVW